MVILMGRFTASMCLFASAAAYMPVPVHAATMSISEPDKRRGAPIAQSFLEAHGDNISIVATQNGASCVASRKLRISDSSYTDPGDEDVPFSEITRSPASSLQAIARPGNPIAFRVQLKYSPDRTNSIEMAIGDQTVDLADALETSGDSLLLQGDIAQILIEGLGRDAGSVLRATSKVTGRLVADRMVAPDMTGLEACLDTLQRMQVQNRPGKNAADRESLDSERPDRVPSAEFTPIEDQVQEFKIAAAEPSMSKTLEETEDGRSLPALPTPVTGIRVDFVARPDPDARISPDKLADCRMRDIPETVFLGRVTGVTGFFSQTSDVYVAFDDQGKVQRAYIPGIFDSDLTSTQGRARVSLAADTNLPDRPNAVRGCLGDAPLEAPVCVISEEDDRYSVAECGVLGMRETRDDFLPLDTVQDGMTVTGTSHNSISTTMFEQTGTGTPFARADLPAILPRLSGPVVGNPGQPPLGDDWSIPGEINNPLSPVPLPAAFWMMMGSLAGLFLLRSRRQKEARRWTG